ncbi:type II secretion system F family protein [candidate division KSB1 bacterium]|nr:type II secretion system F family protein [candidate division KSB1 bacterium]
MENELIIKLIVGLLIFVSAALGGVLLAKFFRLRAQKIVDEAEKSLDQLYSEFRAKEILNFTIYSMLIAGLLGFLLTSSIIIAILFATGGYFLPKFYIRRQQTSRINKFNEQLVPAVDLMANSLKSGFSLPQAFEMITKEMGPPISQEFAMVLKENRLGISLDEALANFQKRVKSDELELVITATNIARETGGNLAEIFARIAKTIRDRDEMQGKIKSLTAEGKMQGIFVGVLPFLLGIILTIIDPEMMQPMWTTPLGYVFVGLAVVLVAMGGFFIKKIITIDI